MALTRITPEMLGSEGKYKLRFIANAPANGTYNILLSAEADCVVTKVVCYYATGGSNLDFQLQRVSDSAVIQFGTDLSPVSTAEPNPATVSTYNVRPGMVSTPPATGDGAYIDAGDGLQVELLNVASSPTNLIIEVVVQEVTP